LSKPSTADRRPTRLSGLTVFAPLRADHQEELQGRLKTLRVGGSPFDQVPGTHFARLAVLGADEFRPQKKALRMRSGARLLDFVTHLHRGQKEDCPPESYLLFHSIFDVDAEADTTAEAGTPRTSGGKEAGCAAYLEGLRQSLQETADLIWGLCTGYPGRDDAAAFCSFFTERSVPARYTFTASDDQPPVEKVRNALHLRQRVIDLAVDSDGLPDDELVRQVRQVFGPEGTGHLPPLARPVAGGALAPVPVAEPSLEDPTPAADALAPGGRIPMEPDLDDVQNLVTSGYPRHLEGLHLLLRVTDPGSARRWLRRVAEVIPTAGWAKDFVDRLEYESPERSADFTPEGRSAAPGVAVHVALSHTGLSRIGLSTAQLAGFSGEFRAGMASREAGLAPGRGTAPWQAPFVPDDTSPPGRSGGVDLLVMFSGADREALLADLADRPWLRPGAGDGLQVLREIWARRIREDQHGPGDSVAKPGFLEHFGFVDGLSQPRVHGVTPGRRAAELPPGEVLLGYKDVDGDLAGAGLPASLARNGSYLVYRKLEQDVPAFREMARDLATRLPATVGTDPKELAAAKLMGRWRDGTPLTLAPHAKDATVSRNGFGFQATDAEGQSCPVGAHVRRANPRDSRPVDPNPTPGGEAELETTLAMRHRMLRRGIPYGKPLPESDDGDDQERGLLFVALVGDVRRQFEFIQAHWMADGNAFRLGSDRDVLAGAGDEGNKFVVQGTPPTFARPPRPLVTCRGGEYFFLPGISALKMIAEG
jgi:Dyp-type peroxidase family